MLWKKKLEEVFSCMAPTLAKYLANDNRKSVGESVFSVGVRLKNHDGYDGYPVVQNSPVQSSPNPKQLFFRLPEPVDMPFEPQISVTFELTLATAKAFAVTLTTDLTGEDFWRTDTRYLFSGNIDKLRTTILGNTFAEIAVQECVRQILALNAEYEKCEALKKRNEKAASLDINDYCAMMEYARLLPEDEVDTLGQGMLAVKVCRGTVLVNTKEKKCRPLSDKEGTVLFCKMEDIPEELVKEIRASEDCLENWNMTSHSIALGRFDGSGISNLTWIILPYYYCPADDEGFGEEEELEVAITCRIDVDGKLVDTPVRKPYEGPRR